MAVHRRMMFVQQKTGFDIDQGSSWSQKSIRAGSSTDPWRLRQSWSYRDAVDEHGVPVELHLVMDNYAAHKHANVRAWLADPPRFKVHFTPTHAWWMNLVEVCNRA